MVSKSYSQKIWKTAILPIVDFISIVLGSGLIYLIRYRWLDDNFFGYNFGIKQIYGITYLMWTLILALLVILIYAFLGIYEINRRYKLWRTLLNLGVGVFVVLLGLITFFFFYEFDTSIFPEGVPVSRFILATGGFLVLYVIILGRLLIWLLENLFYKLGFGKVDVVVIGRENERLINFLQTRNDIAEVFHFDRLNAESYNYIKDQITRGRLSEIYLLSNSGRYEMDLATLAERQKLSFIFSPLGLQDYQVYDLKPISIQQKVYLQLKYTKLDGWQIILKRVFDILFSLTFLLLFSWLYFLIAIIIKLDSPGPIFYGNKRVGPNGKEFTLWKFRRMRQEYCVTDSNQTAMEFEKELINKSDMRGDALYKISDDPRTTRVGSLLEKFSLDELPQFFNVLIGNMSLVGPRPHQLREVNKYETHHFKVMNIKPGITGMAQVNGRSDLTFDQEVFYDTYYVENWNFFLDLWIIIKTPLVVIGFRHKN